LLALEVMESRHGLQQRNQLCQPLLGSSFLEDLRLLFRIRSTHPADHIFSRWLLLGGLAQIITVNELLGMDVGYVVTLVDAINR
jgi:hypothetical protein